MAITAREVLEDAITILQDPSNVRWPLPELRNALNSGLRAMATLQPRSTSKTQTLTLVQGTQQALPAGVHLILRVVRNVNGPEISPIDRDTLDHLIPDWHDTTVMPYGKMVQHLITDASDPEVFWVFPGNDATGQIICQVSKMPTMVDTGQASETAIASYEDIVLDVADTYFNALVNYVLYKAFSKDIQMAGNANRAAAYLAQFNQDLGITRAANVADGANAKGVAS